MSGTLYVVATPIGNLEDITLRALRLLREVAIVAAEDTRHTRKLLQHSGIDTPIVSLHDHNERSRTPELLTRLQAGEDVALVSDAGTPLLSDPGFHLVRAALDAGVRVQSVPGPSALTAALAVAGVPCDTFTFVGFPPARAGERGRWLEVLAGERRTLVMFETPHRIRALLSDVVRVLGDRQVVLARELTKLHEEVLRGTASELHGAQFEERGEFVVLVSDQFSQNRTPRPAASDAELYAEFCDMTKNVEVTRRSAVAALAKRHGRAAREIYAALERAKTLV